MQLYGGGDEFAKKKDIANPNLLTGSKDFTGNWLWLDQVKQKDKYLDFTAIYVNWAWNGVSQYIAVNKGETFTFSAYAKGNAGSQLRLYAALNSDSEGGYKKAEANPSTMPIMATGDWQKVSFTFTILESGTIKPRLEGDSSNPFWVAGMKLERGAVATPWCPALEDFTMNSEYNSTRVGLNLIKGSALDNASQYSWDTSGATANWSDHLLLSQNDVTQYIYVSPNTTYTFSFILDYLDTVASDTGFYFVEQKDRDINTEPYKDNRYTWATGMIENAAGLHTFSFTTGAECHLLKMYIRYKGSSPNGFQLRKVKLEKGDVATQWCPATEDYAIKSVYAQTMLKCVPHVNLLKNSAGPFFPQYNSGSGGQPDANAIDQWQVFTNSTVTLTKGETYTVSAMTNGVFSNNHEPTKASNKCVIWIGPPISMVISGENTSANTFTWNSDTGTYPLRVNRYGADSQVKCWNIKIEHGSQATDWTPCPLDD